MKACLRRASLGLSRRRLVPTPAHERKLRDARGAELLLAREDLQLRARRERVVAYDGERDLAAQARREDCRGDAPDLAAFGAGTHGRVRGRLRVAREDDSGETLRDVAAPVYARDYLLPRVAALRV